MKSGQSRLLAPERNQVMIVFLRPFLEFLYITTSLCLSGTIILKPGTITLAVKKKSLVPINDKQKVREILDKYKSSNQNSTQNLAKKVTVAHQEDLDDLDEDPIGDNPRNHSASKTSLRERFLHRKSKKLT